MNVQFVLPSKLKRKLCRKERRFKALFRVGCGLLLVVMVFGMGCASRQKINVKSEGVPHGQKQAEAPAESEDVKFPADEKGSAAPISPEEEISEFPLPADQMAKDTMPPTETEEAPLQDPTEVPPVAPLPLLEEEQVDLSKVPMSVTDIFFDYDQYRIRQDAITVLETNAKVLIWRYPNRKVVIQGHCDERGTREYNLVLGERRAMAVKKYLTDLGVPEENLQVISYGKEKPFCLEHSKKCWQKNRRSHFVIN